MRKQYPKHKYFNYFLSFLLLNIILLLINVKSISSNEENKITKIYYDNHKYQCDTKTLILRKDKEAINYEINGNSETKNSDESSKLLIKKYNNYICHIYLPKGYSIVNNYPVLFIVHGYRQSAKGLLNFCMPVAEKYNMLLVSIRWSGREYDAELMAKDLPELYANVIRNFSIDFSRTYILGARSGATVACVSLLTRSIDWKGILCIDGFLPENYSLNNVTELKNNVYIAKLDYNPAFSFSKISDEIDYLKVLGLNVKTEVIHNIKEVLPSFNEGIWEWLFYEY